MKDKLAMILAFWLPRRIAMWAAIRVGAHATEGMWVDQEVPALLFMEALTRWDKS